MTRKQMLKNLRQRIKDSGNKVVLSAIVTAIDKWINLVNHFKFGKGHDHNKSRHYPQISSCALCEIFLYNGNRRNGCGNCILRDPLLVRVVHG